jgi:magnesium chelatase family protein
MPDTAVRESRERIKSALLNSGFGYPNKSVTINLAPANVRKEGAGFDLPMALGILGAMGAVQRTDQHLLVGELSLDGTLRPVRGILSMAVCAHSLNTECRLHHIADPRTAANLRIGIETCGSRGFLRRLSFQMSSPATPRSLPGRIPFAGSSPGSL